MKLIRVEDAHAIGVRVWELDFGEQSVLMLSTLNELICRTLEDKLGYFFLTTTVKEGKIRCYSHILVSYKKMEGALREAIADLVPVMGDEVKDVSAKEVTDILWNFINE